jgi:hypothetical protein
VIRRRDAAVIAAVLVLGYFLILAVGHAAVVSISHSLRALTSR